MSKSENFFVVVKFKYTYIPSSFTRSLYNKLVFVPTESDHDAYYGRPQTPLKR